uniref:BEN domain-containing protein n=2 Tax=Eptatretus burgeri TaxID=7764 RepID=A0A8C4QB47_EPTBU
MCVCSEISLLRASTWENRHFSQHCLHSCLSFYPRPSSWRQRTPMIGAFVLCFFFDEERFGVVKAEKVHGLLESADDGSEPVFGIASADQWTVDWDQSKGSKTITLQRKSRLIKTSDDKKYLDHTGKQLQRTHDLMSQENEPPGDQPSSMDEWTTSVTTAKKRPAMSLDDQNIGVVKKKQKDVFAEEELINELQNENAELRCEISKLSATLEQAEAKLLLCNVSSEVVQKMEQFCLLGKRAPWTQWPAHPSMSPLPSIQESLCSSSPEPIENLPPMRRPSSFDEWEDAYTRVISTNPHRFVGDLLLARFGKEFLGQHSLTGQRSSHPNVKEKVPKSALPVDTFHCIQYALSLKFGGRPLGDDVVKNLIRWKLNNSGR